jgi:hypothetical protein
MNKSKGRTERKQNGLKQGKNVTKREVRRERILDDIEMPVYTPRIYLCTPRTLHNFANKWQSRLLGPRQHANICCGTEHG